jgi:LuxR family maltose regulon positive regulatory protein
MLVERPKLIELLNEGLKVKLTIVAAPAGYGKTTCLSDWAQQCGYPAVWISLDRYDNDLVQFWSNVIAAVERANLSFGDGVVPHLANLISEAYDHGE